MEKSGALLGVEELLAGVVSVALFLFDLELQFADLLLVSLQVLLRVGVGLVGVVESDLEFVDVGLELLLDAEEFGLALGLGLERRLHRVHRTLVVLAGVLEFLLLLLDSLLDFGADLRHFDLGAEHLRLLGLQGSLGLVESVLEFFLLDFETADDLLHLVHGAASLAELVGQVLDLLSEVLVLAAKSLDDFGCLLLSVLRLEEIGRGVAEITLNVVEFSIEVVDLLLPLVDGSVEALLFLLERSRVRVGALDINLGIVQVSDQSALGLLERGDLRVGSIESLGQLLDLVSLTSLDILEVVGLDQALALEFGFPLLDLSVGLAELAEDFVLSFDFLLQALLQMLGLVLVVLGLGGKGLALTRFLIGGALGLLELRAELGL